MIQNINQDECQFASLRDVAEGYDKTPPASFVRHIKLFIRRHISPSQERALYKQADAIIAKSKGKEMSYRDTTKNIKSLSLASQKEIISFIFSSFINLAKGELVIPFFIAK